MRHDSSISVVNTQIDSSQVELPQNRDSSRTRVMTQVVSTLTVGHYTGTGTLALPELDGRSVDSILSFSSVVSALSVSPMERALEVFSLLREVSFVELEPLREVSEESVARDVVTMTTQPWRQLLSLTCAVS